ncbi:hypothetical protein BKA70DRAFT_1248297 [Coprinopsis sp. MPI-PUGE-AT-0042]|nr:hypothetical protein BKA70DRAFT_1248297 [Coprinopsis sp. MPI-PUGE-AT-0042]
MNEPSPYAPYLGTNRYILSQAEVLGLAEAVKERQAKAAELALAIEQTRARLAELEARHTAHLEFIQGHSQLLSPICRVPEDVLIAIFLRCVEKGNRWDPPSCQQPSVAISQVCRYWRSLSLDTPLLWRNMDLKIPTFLQTPGHVAALYDVWCKRIDSFNDNVRAWTRRSSPHPLRVNLVSWNPSLPKEPPEERFNHAKAKYKSVIDTIVKETLPRLEELVCNLHFMPVSTDIVHLFDRPTSKYRMLRKIFINVIDWHEIPREWTFDSVEKLASCNIFAAPALRSVELYGHWGHVWYARSRSAPATYSKITNLVLKSHILQADCGRRFCGTDVLAMLSNFPRLNMCELNIGFEKSLRFKRPSKSRFQDLNSLTLVGFPPCKEFVQSLDLPALESLHFDCFKFKSYEYGKPKDEATSGIVEAVLQFGHQLKSFSIYPEAITHTAFTQCLQHLPHLSQLHLRWLGRATDSESCIAHLSDLCAIDMCPELGEFQMTKVKTSEIAEEDSLEAALANFIASRRSRNSRSILRTVNVAFAHTFKSNLQDSILRELERRKVDLEGLVISLDHSSPPENEKDAPGDNYIWDYC